HARLLGQGLDGTRALAEQVEQLEPAGAGDRLADPGELLEDSVLEATIGARRHATSREAFKYSIDQLNKRRATPAQGPRDELRGRPRRAVAELSGSRSALAVEHHAEGAA